jgi:hypothetical protein
MDVGVLPMRDDNEVRPPMGLGELVVIPLSDIEAVSCDENGACALQGILFYDLDMDWRRITSWGVESGIDIVHYAPITTKNPVEDDIVFTSVLDH